MPGELADPVECWTSAENSEDETSAENSEDETSDESTCIQTIRILKTSDLIDYLDISEWDVGYV